MKLEKSKNIYISMILNIIIAIFTLFATIAMFTGWDFMNVHQTILESTKLGMLKFFTVQSNLLIGIASTIFVVEELKIIKNKKDNISKRLLILKLLSTTAVGLTFFVVFTYLGPISKGGILSMLFNSNLFFHLIIPILSIVCFIFFEKNNQISFKETFWGIAPTALYEIFYLSNVLIHAENGKVSPIYDWYWFVQNGVWTAIIVAPMMIVISYIISLVLWKLNKNELLL